jgi:hypothetical protein
MGLFLVIGSVALPALAQPIAVHTKGCRLRQGELDRLVRLELGSVLDADSGASGYQVTIDCDGNEWLLRIEDPVTRKALERFLLPPAPSVPEPERLLALSVAQLYRAAWLELLSQDPPPLPPSQPPAASPRLREAARLQAEAVIPTNTPRSARVALDLGVVSRGISHQPVVMPSLGWDLGWSPHDSFWLTLHASLEAGSDQRTIGRVQARTAGSHVGVAFEPALVGDLSASLEADAGLLFTSLKAKDVAPGLVPGSLQAVAFDGSLALGGVMHVRNVRISLVGRAGLLAGAPIGFVHEDDPVDLNGLWMGAFLSSGFEF